MWLTSLLDRFPAGPRPTRPPQRLVRNRRPVPARRFIPCVVELETRNLPSEEPVSVHFFLKNRCQFIF